LVLLIIHSFIHSVNQSVSQADSQVCLIWDFRGSYYEENSIWLGHLWPNVNLWTFWWHLLPPSLE